VGGKDVNEFRKIPCVIQRGGTSKGIYIHARDLPEDSDIKDKVILSIFGSPDKRQIDGLGGADPLTSKVAIISKSDREDADVNYTFGAVDINEPIIDYRGNCGNLSSGVGPFAIDEGLVKVEHPETIVRIYNTNTKKILKAYVSTLGGKAKYLGDYAIDGVPGTGAKILLDYAETAGAVTGKLLPTGNILDVVSIPQIGEIEMSIVDAANPVCFIRPTVLGLSGIEGPYDKKILDLLDKIELIRGTAARMIGLVDDAIEARIKTPSIPLLAIVSGPKGYRSFTTNNLINAENINFVSRVFYMQEMHKTHSATAAVCTSAAALIEGSIVNQICLKRDHNTSDISIGHPGGVIKVDVALENEKGNIKLKRAALGRTSRRIADGFVYVSEYVFQGK
jgi:2-methylaconitate cis-trans-isomerase PrpF